MIAISSLCLVPSFYRHLNLFTVCRAECTGSSCFERSLLWLHMWPKKKKILNIHTVLSLIAFTKDDQYAALRVCVSESHSRLLAIFCFPPCCVKRAILYIKSLWGETCFFSPTVSRWPTDFVHHL